MNFPLCCPSRATYLTGQYSHNHGVRSNDAPTGGYHKLDHTNTLPVWLKDAGYNTAHVGKYLHGYGSTNKQERPPGWTEWYGLIDFSTYQVYDYEMNRNGVVIQYGSHAGGLPDRRAGRHRGRRHRTAGSVVEALLPERDPARPAPRGIDPDPSRPSPPGHVGPPAAAAATELRRGGRERQAVLHT